VFHAKTQRGRKDAKKAEGTMAENEVATQIVDAAFKVHSALGPGLFESVYERVLAYELRKRGLQVLNQQPVAIDYESLHVDEAFKTDLIVENLVMVELKSIEAIAPIHKKQLLTYLRLSDMRLGLLINFNVDYIKDGISRIVNDLE
jgi:GxxExxY protein